MANWTLWTNYLVGIGTVEFRDITKYCNNYSWSDDKDTIAVTLTFDSILDLAEGRSHIILKKDDKVVLTMVVTQKPQKKNSSSYTAQDYSSYLNQDQINTYQFNGQNAKSCIYQILWDNGLTGACTTLNTKISKLYWGKTYMDIIKDILNQCSSEIGEDVVVEMRGTTLWIDKASNLKLDCKYIMGNDYTVTRNMENMKNYVIVSNNATDGTAPTILATVKDDNNIKIFGRMSKILSVDNQTEAQARNTATNYLSNFNATNKEFTATLLDISGCEDIKANRKIYIDISKYGVKGYYKVKNAQHTLKSGTHKVQVTVDFSGVSFEEPASVASSNTTKSNSSNVGSSKADQIIAYAKQFLGRPYVHGGGNPPNSFDCSSFVAYVFNHFGYNLDAYTYTMIDQGTRVSIGNVKPCDMVFFYNTGHVGMYIGNDQFIQAPHTGDVVKISTFSGYYKDNCNAVTRVI